MLFTTSLGGGGAEKHLVRIANHLDRTRFRVSVAVARGGGSYEDELRPEVSYYPLAARRTLLAARPLRRLLRRERPDLLFSVIDNANCLAVAATEGLKGAPAVVVGVQIPPSVDVVHSPSRLRRLMAHPMRLLYPRATHTVALSQGVENDLHEVFPRLRGRTSVIYNAGVDASVEKLAAEPVHPPDGFAGRPVIVACGRLTPQKGFSHLLRSFRDIRQAIPGATLWILGEGELRDELEAEARGLGVREAVWFAGFQDNPYRFMRAADVFVLSSLYEGFGNVVAEAMACGTAVVSTDCPHGPGEIIRSGQSGLLVPPRDESAMTTAVVEVLKNDSLRKRLERGGQARARDFAASTIAEHYGRLFDQLLEKHADAGEAPSLYERRRSATLHHRTKASRQDQRAG